MPGRGLGPRALSVFARGAGARVRRSGARLSRVGRMNPQNLGAREDLFYDGFGEGRYKSVAIYPAP